MTIEALGLPPLIKTGFRPSPFFPLLVIAGLDPAIHAGQQPTSEWLKGTMDHRNKSGGDEIHKPETPVETGVQNAFV